MIAYVFKPSRIINGKSIQRRLYAGRYCLDGETSLTQVPLGTSDKQSAEATLRKIVVQKERERAGLVPPQAASESAMLPLAEHLKVFNEQRAKSDLTLRYVREVESRLRRLFADTGWKLARDISAESFVSWRQRQKVSAKTLNETLIDAHSFTKWLRVHRKALMDDPLESVSPISTVGRETFTRRALSQAEITRLLAVCGPRRSVYVVALYTGLRRNELRQLEWGDVKLDVKQPYLLVRATTTKNRKAASIPLHAAALRELESLAGSQNENERVFKSIFPRIPIFWKDLAAADIERFDASGRKVDFHSFRKTFATMLHIAGVPMRVAMEAMRHSDPKLTMKTYTDSEMLPVGAAIGVLPDIGACSQIRSQNLVASCPDVSQRVATTGRHDGPQTLINTGSGGDLTQAVATCRNEGDGARYWVRTSRTPSGYEALRN